MRIQSIGANYAKYKNSFKSLRTDKNTVATLKNGTKPILENTKLNIYSSLQNIAKNPDKENINFLLDVADNLSYGMPKDSEFEKKLVAEGLSPDKMENTNWSKLLQEIIYSALNETDETDLGNEQSEFARIFGSKNEVNKVQKEVLDLKNELETQVEKYDVGFSAEEIERKERVKKNLNYFVASSEIPFNQKKECLEKFIYILSDDYKITPQLSDKKLRVADEMLNDMLIKKSDDEVLTIKDVNQRQSGICAAISICRKAVAYEDKVRYMEIIEDELSAEPEMSVYDVTDLDSKNKVKIKKINIDYDSALAKGYRIIDTSAHNWMQNAHASGDGTIQTEQYTAFDDKNYGVFDDSSWFTGLPEEEAPKKEFLKALIKEKELISSLDKKRKRLNSEMKNVSVEKRKIVQERNELNGLLFSTLNKSLGEKSGSKKVSELADSLIKFYKSESPENELKISSQMSDEVKSKIICDYINSVVPNMTEEQKKITEENSMKILSLISDCVKNDNKMLKFKSYSSIPDMYAMKKKMYGVAAAHRLAVEADVNLPDSVIRYERALGIPPRGEREVALLKDLLTEIKSEDFRALYEKVDGTIPSEEDLGAQITSDIAKLEVALPKELNDIVYSLLGKNLDEQIIDLYKSIENAVENGNADVIQRYSIVFGVKNDKTEIKKCLDKWIEKLSDNPSKETVQDSIRVLCYEDDVKFGDLLVGTFYNELQNGISQETYDELNERLGGNIEKKLQDIHSRYIKYRNERQEITERWQMPSSRELILNKLEKNGVVISREKLDILKERFDEIQSIRNENESIQNTKLRRKANIEAYSSFTPEENQIIDLIDKSFTSMKKYNKSAYSHINNLMKDVLEEQYSDIGMLNGQFWVREEGSSGLVSNEQVRILEQMTGNPYHIEYDVDNAVKLIKKGDGSGILSSSVCDDEYAFHAQYIPGITKEEFINPVTGEVSKEDVLWTDNSWGRSERDCFWNGKDGHLYTNYGSNYGWKNGFITDDSYRIGLPVKNLGRATGFVKSDNDEFALFSDVVLPGAPKSAYQKLYKMYNYIFSINEGEEFLNHLEKQIMSGRRIDPDKLIKIDDLVDGKTDKIEQRIKNEINSEEAFNKLPDNDSLKFLFNNVAVYGATDIPWVKEEIATAETPEELEKIKSQMFEDHIEQMISVLGKTADDIDLMEQFALPETLTVYSEMKEKFGTVIENPQELNNKIFPNDDEFEKLSGSLNDLEAFILNKIPAVAVEEFNTQEEAVYFIENMQKKVSALIDDNFRIKSLESSVLLSKPLAEEFINAVDKYLEPKNDKELLELIKQMQNAPTEVIEPFFEALSPEDVGINYKSAYDCLHKFKLGGSEVRNDLSQVLASKIISEYVECSDDDAIESTPDEYFRSLYIKLADMDVQKFIKGYKNEAFEKYKVRQAFPQPVVLSDDAIADSAKRIIGRVEECVGSIAAQDVIIDVINSLNDIHKKYSRRKPFNELLSGNKISIEKNEEFLNDFYGDLAELSAIVDSNETFGSLYTALNDIVSNLETDNGYIGGARTADNLNVIVSFRDEWKRTGMTVNKLEKEKKGIISDLNRIIRSNAKVNIDPKYRNDYIEKLKNYVNLYKKGADDDTLDVAFADFVDFVTERHITKNPVTLLSETIKTLQENPKGSEEYQSLKGYLKESLKVAQQTKIQYQLVQNMHEGISSKTKDMLSMFKVTMADGSSCNMDSENGMLYLIKQLQNVSDNHVTLNLFLSQSGLAKRAVSALVNNFNIQGIYDDCDNRTALITGYVKDIVKIDMLTRQFMTDKAGEFDNIEETLNGYVEFIKENTKDIKDSTVLYNFLNYFNNIQIPDNINMLSGVFAADFVNSIIMQDFDSVFSEINSQIDILVGTKDYYDETISLISEIKIPQDSPEEAQRREFLEKYEECKLYMENEIQKLSALIQNYNFD